MKTRTFQRASPVALAAVAAAALALAACGSAGGKETQQERAPLVEAVQARYGSLPLEEVVNGVVKARNQVTVRPEIAAPITAVLVRSGEAVTMGQPLVRLREDELREQLRQAEADVRLAEAEADEVRARVAEAEARLGRTRKLAAEALISTQELETQEAQLLALEAGAAQAAARVEQARATAQERRSALAKTVVRAPVAGRVGQRQAEVGMRADPGTALFVIGDLDEVMVEVPLTQRMLERIEAGMPVRIQPRESAGEPIAAEVSRISPFLAEESFTTIGEIDVDNRDGRLRPGMFVEVRILYGESRQATLVPASALWEDPATGQRGIFVIENGGGELEVDARSTPDATVERTHTAVFRTAEVLAEGGGTAGVDGLREGDWVVVVGQHLLRRQARDEARDIGGEEDGAGGGGETDDSVRAAARVRPTTWERVQGLQDLESEDLTAGFLAKQQKIAAALGAEIPASEDEVHRVLETGQTPPADPAGGG